MKASITIEGVEILVPELQFLHTKLGRQLARVVLKAGLNVIGKQMKIPISGKLYGLPQINPLTDKQNRIRTKMAYTQDHSGALCFLPSD